MALCSDAAMVLYYDIAGDTADHDDWHTYEHMHERLSIPGFVRATRWVATAGAPRYMVIYEVADTGVATAPAYLERLNNPTAWTSEMMPRFRGMVRGFCSVVAGAGFGLGHAAMSLRFTPAADRAETLGGWLADEIMPAMASRRGMAGIHLLHPAPPPPMTKEQAIRGPDAPMSWLLLATGYENEALSRAVAEHLDAATLERQGANPGSVTGHYQMHYTATAREAARMAANPPLPADRRRQIGVRR